MKQVVNAWSVLLLFTGAVVSHGRKIVQDHHAAIETDADKEFGTATLQRFEAKAMQLLAHLESKINSVDTHRVEQDAPQIVTIPQTATLPARNTSHPMEMFEGCKASSPVEALLRRTSQVHEEETQEAVNESTALGARCALYQMPMTYYRWDRSTASSSCCDSRSKDCSGCERMGSGKCTVRESAFVKLKGDDMHTACMDIVWVNGKGKTCQQLSSADCNDFRFQGTSSREACCKCGGGVKTATSFKYDDHAYILGEHVSMWPQPRTATRYGLNENCEFAMYNLTLNGATGEVSFIKGAGKPKEPFRISCKVTAFQPHHLFFTATVTVTMAELSYGPSLLLFTPKTKSYTLQKFSPPKSHWKDFQMMCAPDAKWVTMDKTGDLKLAEAKETGAVDSVKDVYKGQTATVCHVFGLLRKSPTAEWEKKAVDFILVKPKPAKKLSYSTSLIASSISQVVPPVLPVPFKEGDMAPNAYTMRCDKAGFTFDSIHGIGFYDGHPLLELQPNGQLSLNIGPSFVHIFDSMGSSKHNRKIGLLDLKLKCRIFGSFGDAELEPISARMDIVVSDSTCWVQEKMPYRNIRRWRGVNSHAECQNTCRNTASCSHYRYIRRGAGSANAYCYDTKRDETRSTATVWSKVPDCNPMNTCVKVDAPTWLERGIYCPVGYDIDRQSMTYLKDGKTPKETIYLRRYKAGVDRTVDGCNSGGWLLQEKDANDFVSLSKGVFEFSGPLVGCKVKGVSYTGLPCEQPGNITEEGADMQPIILDDPNTEDPADFWLHPCDCASKMWGDKPPVDPQVFAQMPPESPDEFVPSPMLIVEGQFVCPPGYMLGDGPLFESDIESMEVGDCEIRCKNNDDCHFFWHGSQHSANTCRLYSRCDNLLREPGVEGVLKAVPRSPVCLVNNPEMCWTKSMRRYALTSQQPPGEFQFLYWTLHAQCDYMLLLGGWGVSACTRPSHRTLKSHRWKHKRLLPEEFAHGTRLKATCWNERYKGIRLGIRGDEVATCVSGSWFSSSNLPGFGDFSCVGCVQVGTSGFGDVEAKRQQELYYFNKLALSIHSEVNPIADAKVNCMEPVRPKAGQETSLPEDLKKVHTFDLKGHDFTIINDVIGDQTLWANNEASKNKYTYQSLPEALAACAADSDCWFVSRSEGTKVGLALRRFDLRKGNTVRFVGAKTWVKSLANPCIGNCAALRPVKCGPGVSACGRSLVDGRKAGSLWRVSPHANSHHCHQKKWVQIDLGSIKAFDQVKVFGYADGRRYCGHSILVSNNEKDWKHVYANNGWKAREHGKGNTFNLGSQVGRFVRVYASRSTSNIGIHLLEVEIYRAAVHQPKLPGSHWITDQHVKELRAKARKPSVLQDGLVMYYYYGQSHCNVPDLGKLTPEHYVIVPKVSGFPGIRQHDHFCVRCIGFVNIRKRGHYYFYTSSDDGSLLYLNGHLIVNNNGCHANQQRGSTRRWLEKGRHRLVADMCENAWGQYFEVRYKGPDTGNRVIAIPRSALKYEKAATEVELKDGAECNYYYGRHDCNVPNLDNLNPSHIVTVPEIYMSQSKFTEINQADNFCARCTAQVAITKEGHYKFTTASDDGSLMYLNGQQIVDNNGCHPEQERTSSNQWLTPGYHLVQVDMCENKWGEALKLRYQGPDTGNRKVKVSKSVLKHEKAGLECKYFYHRHHCWLPDLGRLHAHHTVTVPDIWMDHGKFPAHRHRDAFCMRCSGYLVIRRAGHYRFSTSSDDGSFLFISGHKVVDNNGCHGTQERQSTWRWLHAGKHRFTADMCEKGGGESFKVMYQGPDTGNRKIKIPKESLLKPGTATNTKSFQALDTVIADFRQHGTLKSGKIVFSKHSEKITCKIFCDDVLVHEEYHNHIGHRDREVSIPEICKGARKVKLQGGAANGGTCGFKSNKLELFKFMPTRTLTKSQVSTIKDRAASCRARYSASGQVTIKLDDYGEIAPGNKVNFGRHVRSKCEVHCNGKKQTVYSGRRRHRHRQTFDVSKGCIGATTMVLKGGGKCGGCQIDKGHLKVSPYPTHPSEVMIPAKKIVAWFKSEDAGPTWRSSVGKFTASARRRNGVVAYKARGYGAKTPIRYIQGHTGHHFDFGRVLQDHYTVCSVTRYLSAGSTGRILTGSKSNFLHGHHAAGVGLAYANGWQTPTGLRKKSTKWLTMCSSPGAKYVFVDGVDIGTHKTDYYVDQHLEINGRLWPKEKSDWAVAELITWNYILTREQMKEASTYLMKKLMVGGEMDACKVILKQPEHWRDWRGSYNKQVLNRLRLHKSTKRVDLALDSTSGWCSSSNGGHQWVEIDLRATEKVMGIIIQTFHKSDDYVFAFKVQYKASDKGSWRTIPNRFTGMSHKTEDHVRAYFAEAVEARFVRLTSFWWHRNICLRAAVMLCKTHLENEVNLLQAKTCPTNYNSESWSESDSGSRHLRIGGSPDCLRVTQTKKRMALLSATCDGDDVHQMIPSSDIGYLFTMLHRNSWLQDNVLLPGIKAEYFYNLKADHCVIPDLMWRAPDKVEVLPKLDFWKKTSWSGLKHNDKFSARMSGVLMINEPGWYEFWLWADDSSRIFLNHREIGSLGGCGATRHRYVKRKLTMGSWPVEVQFYESVGQASLRLEYRGPDTHKKKRIVPGTAFAHMADKTQWMPTSAIARGCIGNTALGSLQPDMFLVSDLAKGVPVDCRFVPLLSKELPVQIATTRSFKDNSWPLWWEDLESWEMACPEGKVLQSLDMLNVNNKLQVKYTCATASGLGQCYPSWTDQQDAHEFKDSVLSKSILKRLHIVCPQHDLLSAVHFEYSEGGLWARFKYVCCKEAGAPVAMVSKGPDHARVNRLEGTYCPEKVGSSGRLDYIQKAWGSWQTKKLAKLTFSEVSGKWCIGSDCSSPGDNVEPMGLQLGGFDATDVSDFDGKFEAKGVKPNTGGLLGQSPVPKLKPPPPPRRPKAPKKPKLETFEPEMPKYSDKCVGYGDLWKKVQETTVNEAGEEESNAEELETEEESQSGYKAMHPCDLAAAYGGVRSKWAGGDGKAIPKPMPYNELMGCLDRDGAVSFKGQEIIRRLGFFVAGVDLPAALASTTCTLAPEILTAPMGFGASADLADICKGIVHSVTAGVKLLKYAGSEILRSQINKAAAADCAATQANFARMFCDVHCVRDAVIRGDRTILRNLKKATDITNGNAEKLAEWIVKTQQLDVSWLAEKIDHQSVVQSLESNKQFTNIKELLNGGDKKELFLAIKQQTIKLQSELRGYVDGASFGKASLLAASDALEKFNGNSKSVLQDGNSTEQVFGAFDSLVSLRAKLRTASDQRSRVDHIAMSVTQGARQMQEQLKLQRATLGIYRENGNRTLQAARQRSSLATSERHAMVLDLDRIWWKIRGAVDSYVDEAENEINSFESGSQAMANYQQCSMDFASLLSVYRHTMAVTDTSHRALKKTWRLCSNLIGELASHLDDGEAFVTFLQQEGCASPLAFQTLEQVRDVMGSLRMLYHRFAVSGLASPELSFVESTVDRIKKTWSSAQAVVCNRTAQLPIWYFMPVDTEKALEQLEVMRP